MNAKKLQRILKELVEIVKSVELLAVVSLIAYLGISELARKSVNHAPAVQTTPTLNGDAHRNASFFAVLETEEPETTRLVFQSPEALEAYLMLRRETISPDNSAIPQDSSLATSQDLLYRMNGTPNVTRAVTIRFFGRLGDALMYLRERKTRSDGRPTIVGQPELRPV